MISSARWIRVWSAAMTAASLVLSFLQPAPALAASTVIEYGDRDCMGTIYDYPDCYNAGSLPRSFLNSAVHEPTDELTDIQPGVFDWPNPFSSGESQVLGITISIPVNEFLTSAILTVGGTSMGPGFTYGIYGRTLGSLPRELTSETNISLGSFVLTAPELALITANNRIDITLTANAFIGTGRSVPHLDFIELAITTAVPEPSTALLLAIGLVGIAARRRRLNWSSPNSRTRHETRPPMCSSAPCTCPHVER